MFQLQNDPPRPTRWTGDPAPKSRQRVLFAGMDCLPDQRDLFPTDACPIIRRAQHEHEGDKMSYTPGPLWKVPIQERCQRVAERVNCGVYTRLAQADYSNLGAVLFDELRMARDLDLSVRKTKYWRRLLPSLTYSSRV